VQLISDELADHLTARLQDLVTWSEHPRGGLVVHGMYAPEALLSLRYEVTPAAELEAQDYALHLAARADLRAEGRMQGTEPAFRDLTLAGAQREEGDRIVAWFDTREEGSGQSIAIGVGFRLHLGEWRVGWLTLAATPQTWDYELGRAQANAEFPAARAADLAAPRTWLDLAWHRQVGYPRPPLLVLPEARFSCQSSGTCCGVGFDVDVDRAAQDVIDAIPWERYHPPLKGSRLPVRPDGRLQLKGLDETCRFLDERRHCRIHAILGRAAFPVCDEYPFIATGTPDGVAITTSVACGTVRANLGTPLTERFAELYARRALFPPAAVGEFRLEHDGPADWPAYRAAEADLLTLLGRAELPLDRRFWLGSLYLDALRDGLPLDWAALEKAPAPVSTAPLPTRLALLDTVAQTVLLPVGGEPALAPDDGPTAALLTTMARSLIFGKRYVTRYSLRASWNAAAVMTTFARQARARHPDGQLEESVAWSIGAVMMHGRFVHLLKVAPALEALFLSPHFIAWLLGEEPAQAPAPTELAPR
jgi:Fe-S-cluster containining protein